MGLELGEYLRGSFLSLGYDMDGAQCEWLEMTVEAARPVDLGRRVS